MIEQEWREFIAECVERMNAIADKAANRRSKALTGNEQAEFDILEQWATDARDQADRLAEIAKLATGSRTSPVTSFHVNTRDKAWGALERWRDLGESDARAIALDCIEADQTASDDSHEYTTKLVERLDGPSALYVSAVSNPDYQRAFEKVMSDPTYGLQRLTPEEANAMHMAERAFGSADTGVPGVAVPYAADHTITLTETSSAANPV